VAARLARRKAAMVAWSGCRLAATERTPMSRYVARAMQNKQNMPLS
jgi:hypothetical protein